MTPAEAGGIEYEEPDWDERFEFHCARWPTLPRYLQEDCAFPHILREWRKFHWTPYEGKKRPALASEAMIALAQLGIMPPRSAWKEIDRDNQTGYQHDEHMWLSFAGEQWRITAVDSRTLILEKGFEGERYTKQIDLNKAKWEKWLETAVAVLEAKRANDP